MSAILVSETAKVYSEPNESSLSLTTLRKGDEFEKGKEIRKKNEAWAEVTLPSGQRGYIPGKTLYFEKVKVLLLADQVELYESIQTGSNVIKTYPKNTPITAIGIEKEDNKEWVWVKDDEGAVGYVKRDTKFGPYQVATKAGGKKMIITGGIFSVFALIYFLYSLSLPKMDSTMAVLTVAMFAFGAMQIMQGVLQFRKAKKREEEKNK